MQTQTILQALYTTIQDEKEREYFDIHEIRYLFILEKIQELHLPQNAKILDIGVYPPHLFSALQQMGYDVSGISSQHEKVKLKNVEVLNIEKDKFPFADSSFDLVLMTEIMEHLTVNPEIYLKEVKRVLKPGGILLITTPNAVHLKNRMKVLFGKSSSFSLEQLFDTKHGDDSMYYRHNRELTMSELIEIIRLPAQAGNSQLVIRNSEHVSFYTPFRKKRSTNLVKLIGYLITQLLPSLRDSLYLQATK